VGDCRADHLDPPGWRLGSSRRSVEQDVYSRIGGKILKRTSRINSKISNIPQIRGDEQLSHASAIREQGKKIRELLRKLRAEAMLNPQSPEKEGALGEQTLQINCLIRS
jgi:hypothetical protein